MPVDPERLHDKDWRLPLAYWRYRLDLLRGRLPLPADDEPHLHQVSARHVGALGAAHGFVLDELSGHGTRRPALARRWPAVFSDTLLVLFRKPSRGTA